MSPSLDYLSGTQRMAANPMQSPRGMLCLLRLQEQSGSGVSIRRDVEAAHLPSKQKMRARRTVAENRRIVELTLEPGASVV